jgi:hypothetical protein
MEIAFSVYCLVGYGVTKYVVEYYQFVRACCLRLQGGSELRSEAHQDFPLGGGVADPEVIYTVRSKSSRTKAIKTKKRRRAFFCLFFQNRVHYI